MELNKQHALLLHPQLHEESKELGEKSRKLQENNRLLHVTTKGGSGSEVKWPVEQLDGIRETSVEVSLLRSCYNMHITMQCDIAYKILYPLQLYVLSPFSIVFIVL